MRFTFLNLTASSTSTHLPAFKYCRLKVTKSRIHYWQRQRLVTTLMYQTKVKDESNRFDFSISNLQINYTTRACLTYLPKLARQSNLAVRLSLLSNKSWTNVAIQFQEFNLNNLCLWYSRFVQTNLTLCKLLWGLTNLKPSFHGIGNSLSKLLRPKTESLLTVISTRLI